MIKKLLRPVLPVLVSAVLASGGFFALGAYRRADDTKWCKDATAGATVSAENLKEQRDACAVQRRRQRTMFGAVWRKGGEATAACGFEIARMQLVGLTDTATEAAILGKYGIDPSGFDTSDRASQTRFLNACLAHNRQAAR